MTTENPQQDFNESAETLEEALEEQAVEQDEDRIAQLTPEEMAIELEQAQQKSSENWNKYLRLQAEMDNLRRRTERDVAAAHKYSSEKTVESLLPVIDSLERGLDVELESDAAKAMHEGMEMTLKMMIEAMEKNGVKQILPEAEPFNPDEMEAISVQENSEVESNTVLKVVQKGYSLNGRLVRPAFVIVSK